MKLVKLDIAANRVTCNAATRLSVRAKSIAKQIVLSHSFNTSRIKLTAKT